MKLIRCFIVCCSLYSTTIMAQEKWSLEDCVAYGLEHHESVAIAENNRLASEAAVKEVVAGYLPTVSVNGGIDDNIKVQEQVIPAGVFSDEDLRVAFTKQYNTTGTVQLDQVIYDQSLLIGLKAGKYNKAEATATKEQQKEQLIYSICSYYYQIWVHQLQLQYLEQHKETYASQLEISQLQLEKGILSQVDFNRLQVNYNAILSNIRTATKNLHISEYNLKDAIGFPLEKPIYLEKVTTVPETVLQHSKLTDTTFKPEQRTEYVLDSLRTQLLSLDYKRIKYSNLPRLSAYARYGTIGFGDDLDESFSSQQTFSAVGIKLSTTLFEGFGKRAKAKQAALKYKNAEEQQQLNARSYKLQVLNASHKLTIASEAIQQELENSNLAQSVFNATNLQYQKGVASLKDWLDDQLALKQAQKNYLSAMVDFYVATLELKKANGTLDTYYNPLNKD